MKSGYWRRLGAAMVAMLAGLPGMPARAAATDVPPSWVAYAQLVGQQFQSWIEADDVDADRFHQYLDARMSGVDPTQPPLSTILVRAWIGADGSVTRVVFDSMGDAQADDALRGLLAGHRVPAAPPVGLRQPLRVRLRIQPNPDAAPKGGVSSTAGARIVRSATG